MCKISVIFKILSRTPNVKDKVSTARLPARPRTSNENSTIVNIPTQKGVGKLNRVSTEGDDEIIFENGDSLHSACCTDYISLKKISQYVAKQNLNQNADDEGM